MSLNTELILQESLLMHNEYLNLVATNTFHKEQAETDFKVKYEYSCEKLPSILGLVLSSQYDYNRLKYMLDMKNQLDDKKISKDDADVKVGQVLVDEIVKPMLDKNKS